MVSYLRLILLLTTVFIVSGHTAMCEEAVDTSALFQRISKFDVGDMTDLADSSLEAGDEAKALSLYMAVSSYQGDMDSQDKLYKIRACIGAGDILMRKCNFAGSLDYYVKGLKISESMKSRPYAARLYNAIGRVYSSVSDFQAGIRYNKIALLECRAHPDPEVELKILNNLAGYNTYIDSAKEARLYRDMSARLDVERDSEAKFLDIFIEGMVLSCEGKQSEAIEKFHAAERYAADSSIDPRFRCSALQHIYIAYDKMHMADSAYVYMKRCERIAGENGILWRFPNLFNTLSGYYRRHGDEATADSYRARYLEIRDSLTDEREFDAVRNIQFQHEAAKVADRIDTLQRQKEERDSVIRRHEITLAGVLSSLLVVTLLLVVIYRQKRRLMDSYRRLYDMNRSFESQIDNMKIRMQTQEADSNAVDDGSGKYSTSNLKNSTRRELAAKIEDAMERQRVFCNPDFSLDQFSELLDSNTAYVSRTINETYDRNFSSFVNEYRVRMARELLSDPAYDKYTVKSIGEKVGFKSQSSFTSVFRKATGLTPSVYQKMARTERKE